MSQGSPKSHDVFISHSPNDKAWADAACAVLERHRIRCWIAPRDITPGTVRTAAIIQGLDSCRVMVLIFSGHANASPLVHREVERAVNKGLSILPVRLDRIEPAGGMKYLLSAPHWLDAVSPPMEQELEKLAASVERLLGREGPTVKPPEDSEGTGVEPGPPPPAQSHGHWYAAAAILLLLAAGLALGMMFARGRTEGGTPGGDRPAPEGPGRVAGGVPSHPSAGASVDRPKVPSPRPSAGTAPRVVASDFEDGSDEGWTLQNLNEHQDNRFRVEVKRDASNGWLEGRGTPGGVFWGWIAPPKFRGDHSDKFGRLLQFSIRTSEGHGKDTERLVLIRGGGRSMYVDLGTAGVPPVDRWRTYTIPLDSSGGWKVNSVGPNNRGMRDDGIKQILSNITEIWIKGEFADAGTGGLDNVLLGAGR